MKLTIWTVVTLMFIFLFDLWVENSDNASAFYDSVVKPILDESRVPVVWPVLVFAGLIIWFIRWKATKDKEIEDLQKSLNSRMELLVRKNTELSRYTLQDVLTHILSNFVSKSPYILAVQIYNLEEKNLQGKTKFHLDYFVGHASSQVDVNSIQQHIYECDIKVLREYRKVQFQFKREGKAQGLVNFAKEMFLELRSKNENDYTKEDAFKGSLMFLAFDILEAKYPISLQNLLGEHLQKLDNLVTSNRTGLIRTAIVHDEFYSFTHKRETAKSNRQYLATLVSFKSENTKKVFSIVLDSSILDDEKYNNVLETITQDFRSLLSELETVYNSENRKG